MGRLGSTQAGPWHLGSTVPTTMTTTMIMVMIWWDYEHGRRVRYEPQRSLWLAFNAGSGSRYHVRWRIYIITRCQIALVLSLVVPTSMVEMDGIAEIPRAEPLVLNPPSTPSVLHLYPFMTRGEYLLSTRHARCSRG